MTEPIPEKIPEEQKTAPSEAPQQPKEEIPEGFEKKSIFDFLKDRVEPFHIDRRQRKEEKAKEQKPARKKFQLSNLLLPGALVAGLFFLLWQKNKQMLPALNLSAAQPTPETTVPQDQAVQTPAPNPSPANTGDVGPHSGAYFDEQGRFHSRKYPDKKIL